jgi:hypothetical protein
MRIKKEVKNEVIIKVEERGSFRRKDKDDNLIDKQTIIGNMSNKMASLLGSDHVFITYIIEDKFKIATINCLSSIGIGLSFKGNHPLSKLRTLNGRVDMVRDKIVDLANRKFIVCLQELDDVLFNKINKKYENILINRSHHFDKNIKIDKVSKLSRRDVNRVGYVYNKTFYDDDYATKDYTKDIILSELNKGKQFYVKTFTKVKSVEKVMIGNVHMFSKADKKNIKEATDSLKKGVDGLYVEAKKKQMYAFVVGDFNTETDLITELNGNFKKLDSGNYTHISASGLPVNYDHLYGVKF